MLHVSYRGTDLRQRLAGEGIEFDANGRASQEQRLTADALKELLDERAAENDDRRQPPQSGPGWSAAPASTGSTSCPSGSATVTSRSARRNSAAWIRVPATTT